MPFATAEEEAAEVGEPLRLTVTTSPRHGVDRSLDFAVRLRALGHAVTLHLAARMVRGDSHLDEIVARAHDAAIDDFLVVGGDAPEAVGPYAEASTLLDVLVAHPLRPALVGIGGYPEGHPLIEPAVLDAVLERKARFASYIVTQLCFDRHALLEWIENVRTRGIDLPIYVGAVGPVERRKLLEISMRIGVGPSLRFVRKQRGLTRLFGSPFATAARFYDDVAPLVADPRYGIAGFHFFTFNRLIATRDWCDAHRAP
jgi:methylenetetrahydrofolate reductase (NADPH)